MDREEIYRSEAPLEIPGEVKQSVDGMVPARKWLTRKLRISRRQAFHDPEDMKVLEMQLSAFCYDKVRRKRLSDDLMKIVRHYLLNFLEEDKKGLMRNAIDGVTHDSVHKCLTSQSVAEKQRLQVLKAKQQKYLDLLTRIDRAGGSTSVAAQSQDWSRWTERPAKRKMNMNNSSATLGKRQWV